MEGFDLDSRSPVPLQKDSDPTCTRLQMDYVNPRPGAQKRRGGKEASIVSAPLTVETAFSALAPLPGAVSALPCLSHLPINSSSSRVWAPYYKLSA